MPAAVDIGTLAGRIEFEDRISATLDSIDSKLGKLDSGFERTTGHVKAAAEGFLIGELALKGMEAALEIGTDLIKDFTSEGAAIADVEENFKRLAEGAGLVGDTMLGTLRTGTHNTITDFELMKTVNQDLVAGMRLTDDSLRTLSTGAFSIAQANGKGVKEVFDTINDAMLTGRTRALQLLIPKIDLAKAEQDMADKLSTTVDMLTQEGKLEADRIAILNSVTEATGRLGEQTDGVDEIVAQISTSWKNFYEDLIKTVAASPNVVLAFTTVRDSISAAFGGDSSSLVETFSGWINQLADVVTEYAPTVVRWFVDLKDEFVALYHGAVEAWSNYGPVILTAFTSVKDWVLGVFDAVTSTWNALPDWMKTVAERSAMFAGGLLVLDSAVESTSGFLGDLIGTMGNLTTTFSGMPAAFANIGGAIGMLKGLGGLDFTSLAGAAISLKLMGEAALTTIGPLGAVALAAAAVFAAWEVGKMQPVSDFFQNLGLIIMGYSAEERAAMIETDHLTQAQVEQEEKTHAQSEAIAKAKEITNMLAEAQTKATETNHGQNEELDRSKLVLDQSAEAAKKYAQAWIDIDKVGHSTAATLAQVDGAVVEAVKYYLEAGVALDKLKAAYLLTDEQAQAINKTWTDQQKILADETKAAMDVIDVWIKMSELGEDQNKLLYNIGATVQDDIIHYHDLGASVKELALGYGYSEAQINAVITAHEKDKVATDALSGTYAAHGAAVDSLAGKVHTLAGEYISQAEAQTRAAQGGAYSVTSQNFMKALQDVATTNGWNPSAQGSNINYNQATQWAQRGYSFQEILTMFANQKAGNNGPLPPPQGPRIPGFREGGVGDFGDGTLAMLHGREAIVPLGVTDLPPQGHTVNIQNHFVVNGTGADVARIAGEQIMRQLKSIRQFGAS